MLYKPKVKSLDIFESILRTLKYTGYYKPVPYPKDENLKKIHKWYRYGTVGVLMLYNLQHVIYIFKVIGDMNKIVDVLNVLVTSFNVMVKLSIVNKKMSGFDALEVILNGSHFAPTCKEDEQTISRAKAQIDSLSKFINRGLIVIALLWYSSPFLEKYFNDNIEIACYFPFETKSWIGYSCANIYITSVMIWIGYGEMSFDVFISGLYTQARVQLTIMRYHLEHMVDGGNQNNTMFWSLPARVKYKDDVSQLYQRRFVVLVKKYDQIYAFTKEVESILNGLMLGQFLCSTSIICIALYKISSLSVNAEFLYLLLYLLCLLFEVFLYCYCGTQLQSESESLNDSLYLSDWMDLSPKFRRQLLIVMTRWGRPMKPAAAGIVPIALSTFIAVLRGSNALYTILMKT